MPWNVAFDAAHGAVELRLSGTVMPRDLEESAEMACALARKNGVMSFLVDLCQVTEFTSLAQLYELPAKRYAEMGVSRLARAAVVPGQDAESLKAAQFYEDTCRNRGWNVKLFADRDRALAWLLDTGTVEQEHQSKAA